MAPPSPAGPASGSPGSSGAAAAAAAASSSSSNGGGGAGAATTDTRPGASSTDAASAAFSSKAESSSSGSSGAAPAPPYSSLQAALLPPSSSSAADRNLSSHRLAPEEELRVEVSPDETITARLVSGTCEVFGAELVVGRDYPFSDANVAFFSWHGCQIDVRGCAKVQYTAGDTPMVSYITAHAQLESARKQALRQSSVGPRVLVCGPCDSGKSTLTRILLNYAVREGHQPLFVDLNVGQSHLAVPGAIAASPMRHLVTPTDRMSAGTEPVVFFHGRTSPSANSQLYEAQVEALAACVDRRLAQAAPAARASGVVVATCAWDESMGLDVLKHIIAVFSVSTVLVLGHDRLHSQLKSAKLAGGADVVKLQRSGGVVTRARSERARLRALAIRRYFHGGSEEKYFAVQKFLKFDDISLFRMPEAAALSDEALPIDAKSLISPLEAVPVYPNRSQLNSVLAVSLSEDIPNLTIKPVAGFVHVTAVEPRRKQFVCLAPNPHPMPTMMLLHGHVKYVEE